MFSKNLLIPGPSKLFEVECMPIVQVSVWEGITPENKKKTVEGITKVFEDMGVPKDAVHIVIYEAPKK